MPFSDISLLIIFLFPLAYSPGPGNMFFAALGARYGLRASLPANLGYHFATFVVSFAIGAGISVVLAKDSAVFITLQKLGAVYIIWLAWRLYRSHTGPALADAKPAGPFAGAMLLLLNPKGYLIMALMFSQFSSSSISGITVIAAIFTLNNMIAFLFWTIAGQSLARLFQTPKSAQRLNAGFAFLLACVAIWLLTS